MGEAAPGGRREVLLARLASEAAEVGLGGPGQVGAVPVPSPRAPAEWVELLAEEGVEEALEAMLDRFFVHHAHLPGLVAKVGEGLVDRCGPAAARPLAAAVGWAVLAVRLRPEMLSAERTFREVRSRIEQAAQRLIERGEIDHEDAPGAVPGGLSAALLLTRALDTRTVMAIQQEAALSKPEWAVLDAAIHRTALVETPVRRLLGWWARADRAGLGEYLVALWTRPALVLDEPERRRWAVARVASLMGVEPASSDQLVTEAAAELDRAVRGEVADWLGRLGGAEALAILLRVAADPALRRSDPMLVAGAKASLAQHALRLRAGLEAAAGPVPHGPPRRESWGWMFDRGAQFRADRARVVAAEKLARLASSIQGLLRVSRGVAGTGEPLHERAFELELVRLSETLEILLLLADLYLDQPRGAQRLAEALFGMDQLWQREARARIDRQIERLMSRQVLQRLGERSDLMEWLRGLRLVDRETFLTILNRLDLRDAHFPSLEERDWALSLLAVPYAELVFERRMERTLQHRFRTLVRVLHEDGLRARLSAEAYARLTGEFGEQLRDWYSLLVGAKNYLGRLQSHYRELSEEFLFEEDRFKGEVERRQLGVLAAALGLEQLWHDLAAAPGR